MGMECGRHNLIEVGRWRNTSTSKLEARRDAFGGNFGWRLQGASTQCSTIEIRVPKLTLCQQHLPLTLSISSSRSHPSHSKSIAHDAAVEEEPIRCLGCIQLQHRSASPRSLAQRCQRLSQLHRRRPDTRSTHRRLLVILQEGRYLARIHRRSVHTCRTQEARPTAQECTDYTRHARTRFRRYQLRLDLGTFNSAARPAAQIHPLHSRQPNAHQSQCQRLLLRAAQTSWSST